MKPNSSTKFSIRATSLAFACALSVAAAPGVAAAETASADVARAETFAAEAFDAYQKKDYQEAVVLYLKALEASPSADVVLNVAKIYDTKLNDRELAMSFYRRYIADPGADPQRVRTANTRLAELRELELAAKEKPAAVAAATAAAGGANQQTQTAAASNGSGESQKSLPPANDQRGLTGMQWAGVATGLVGLGGLAVGTVFGLSAKSDADIANQECDGNACRSQAGVDAANDASSKANVSTVAFIAGGALTAVGVILLLSGGSSAPAQHDTAHLRISPYVGQGSLGTQVSGRF